MQWILIPFGWLFMVAMALAIVVPYLRGKGELLSPWTLFLLGSANFVGFAAIQTGNAEVHYDLYSDASYLWFVAGALVYYVAAFVIYTWMKSPRHLAQRTFRKWVGDGTAVLVLLLCFCAFLSLGAVLYPNIQFIGQITSIMGQAAGPIALTLALIALVRQPYNPVIVVIFVIVLALSLGVAMSVGSGRRSLLGTAMAFPVVSYWLWARYRSAASNVVMATTGALVVFFLLSGYTALRHRERNPNESAAQRAINSVRMLPGAMLGMNRQSLLGGDAVEVSMVAINHYGTELPHEPFFSAIFVVTNPIPRAFWPGKPEGLGNRIAYETGYASRHHGIFNWGPGIVGHGFHEGGLYILLIYGIVTGALFRYADDLLKRQPDNPILLGVFAAASGQIVGLSRGELGLFTVLIIGAVLTGIVVNLVGRMFFGTGRVYPTPEEEQFAHYYDLPPGTVAYQEDAANGY